MNNATAFTVYDAAAGAGKTYTLVKNYLLKILSNPNKSRYRQILAVTFTNKAVSEMKLRILESLSGFSEDHISEKHKNMFLEIANELDVSEKELQYKSKNILHYILHNYTAFSVQTIDKFTQSVIRAFSYDLGLSTNFEVELDQKGLLELAVDQLINKVGVNQQITKTILDFTKTKINDDASWNIKRSLLEVSRIIFNEDDIDNIKQLSTHSFEEFETFEKDLKKRVALNKKEIQNLSSQLLETLTINNITDFFYRNFIPNHFKKIKDDGSVDFKAAWKQDIENATFYKKNEKEDLKQLIDTLKPVIISSFLITKKLILENQFLERILVNIIQMSLLKSLNDELEKLKTEKQLVLISDFNKIISNTIKDQPTPFIFERLGERYKDYFIDEFQDTSVMQWQNLYPLSNNAVSSINEQTNKPGTVTIVGDAKQAIYRWRGGKAEQFMDLSTKESPFSNPEKETIQLDTNYRSYSNIIEFNNSFFTYIATSFSNLAYKELYVKGNNQKTNSKKGGYVQFDFIEANNSEEKNELYPIKVLENITTIISNGFHYKDICILVRKNKEGVSIANYLNDNQVPVLSQEALLVKNSNEVSLLINLASYVSSINDNRKKLEFLKALAIQLEIEPLNPFLKNHISLNLPQLANQLKDIGIDIDFYCFDNLSIYEAFEYLIIKLKLHEKPNTNLQFFMDFVFEYTQKQTTSINEFIAYWDLKKDNFSTTIPEGKDAVQIMSIHKSKGLEFTIVIYPYADTEIYKPLPKYVWTPIQKYSDTFEKAYASYNQTLFTEYSNETEIQSNQIKELQELDNFNILYVAMTRAKMQLYIISSRSSNGTIVKESFQELFENYLGHTEDFSKNNTNSYYLGDSQKLTNNSEKTHNTALLDTFICTAKENQQVKPVLSQTILSKTRQESIDTGLILHDLMSKIYTRTDLDIVLNHFKQKTDISTEKWNHLRSDALTILNQPLLVSLFNKENKIYNERDFLFNNTLLRPDRVEIINKSHVVIIDYKTGSEHAEHADQMNKYASIFEDMGYKNIRKLLIYIGKIIKINEI